MQKWQGPKSNSWLSTNPHFFVGRTEREISLEVNAEASLLCPRWWQPLTAACLVYVNAGGLGQLPHWAVQIETSEAHESGTRNLLSGYPGSLYLHMRGWQWRSTQVEGDGCGGARWDSHPPDHLWMVQLLLHSLFEPQGEEGKTCAYLNWLVFMFW